jgi:hypothetical protein
MKPLRIIVAGGLAILMVTAAVALASSSHPGHHARPHASPAAVARSGDEQTSPDTDNLQVGDQTGADNGAAARTRAAKADAPKAAMVSSRSESASSSHEQSSGGEQSGESEQGQPGEPNPGHSDPAGNADHQCTGNCVE